MSAMPPVIITLEIKFKATCLTCNEHDNNILMSYFKCPTLAVSIHTNKIGTAVSVNCLLQACKSSNGFSSVPQLDLSPLDQKTEDPFLPCWSSCSSTITDIY
ncbi:hypothetical protein FRX31_013861 [Thalictrum thalictroides]|uniref:Uncharacterized protein n=1 Tax=Thalictrum thalictroides TaxID=46969 RepID=A0A7J6WKC3_THATH|nr:hypothetical protein FRX31_013861 [Thalictrum thalictroides]